MIFPNQMPNKIPLDSLIKGPAPMILLLPWVSAYMDYQPIKFV